MASVILPFARNVRRIMSSTPARLAGLGLMAAALALPVHAALTIQAPVLSAAAAGSGSFDVSITNTGPSAVDIEADSVELGIDGTGVQFTDATVNTAVPYIYSDSLDADFGQPMDNTGVPFPKNDLIAEDVVGLSINFATINPGDTLGLVHVSYSVDPTAALGPRDLTIEDIGGGTSLSDQLGNPVLFTPTNGSLTVTPAPEPSAAALLVGVRGDRDPQAASARRSGDRFTDREGGVMMAENGVRSVAKFGELTGP